MNEIDAIFKKSNDAAQFSQMYIEYLNKVLLSISPKEIAQFSDLLLNSRDKGKKIIFMGNGGSAATASHFANDISIGTRSKIKPFRAISITDNNAVITAIANDDGFDEIFTQQLQVILSPGDLVVAISASGNSPNVLNAINYANENDAITIGITAFDGGKLKNTSKYSIHVPTNPKEYGPAEDAHMILDHLIGAYLSRVIL